MRKAKTMTWSRLAFGLLAASCVLLTGVSTGAPVAGEDGPPVASVVALRGKVQAVSPAGAVRALKLKSTIAKGDTVKTGKRGRMQIRFPDNSLISLGRDTEMTIQDFAYEPEQSNGKLVTYVKQGVFRVMGGAIAKIAPENFQTRTPTATIGIRGSLYAGSQFAAKLIVILLGGIGIDVKNDAGKVEIEDPSFGTTVKGSDQKPEKPRRYSVDELEDVIEGFFGGDDEEQEEKEEDKEDQKEDDKEEEKGEDKEDDKEEEKGEDKEEKKEEKKGEDKQEEKGRRKDDGPGPEEDGDEEDGGDKASAGDAKETVNEVASQSSSGNQDQHQSSVSTDIEKPKPPAPVPPSGALVNGFAVGVAKNSVGRTDPVRVYRNTSAATRESSRGQGDVTHFDLRVTQETGTVEGSMTLTDAEGADASIQNMVIGGSDSDVVQESYFKGLLGGENVINVGGQTGGLSGNENHLESAPAAQSMSPWTSWGYWQVAYDEPGTRTVRAVAQEVRNPQGLWVAGELTPQSYIQGLMHTTGASGVYSGGARCVEIAPDLSHTTHAGTSLLNVFFDSATVTGALTFPELTMETAATINQDGRGFLGTVTSITDGRANPGIASSGVQGDFFGGQAEAIGGSVNARTTEDTRYIGVFSGSKH